MHFSTAVIAAFAATLVSASPLVIRSNTCGAAPTSSNTKYQPISQPSGIQTSVACQAKCEASSSCKSFCFGLVDNVIKCELYSCAASSVPTQSSANLVVYDKACTAVPSVVPTSSNPTGKKVDSSKTSEQKAEESKKSTATKTSNQKATESKQAKASTENTYSTQKKTSSTTTSTKTCGTAPSGSTNNKPIATPAVTSEKACKAKCEANSSCKSFICGEVDNAMVCKLYSVSAAQVPTPTNAAQKKAIKAYDVGCSI